MDTPKSGKRGVPFWKNLSDCSMPNESHDPCDELAEPTAVTVRIERRNAIMGGRRETLIEATNQTALPSRRQDKVTVYVSVVFLKIGEIDTAKETFTAEVFIQSRWREPEFDGKLHTTNLDKVILKTYWNPMIMVDNSVGDPKESIWHTILFNSSSQAYIVECRRVKGQFLENLELYDFPFDTQDLTVTLSSARCEEEVTLEQDLSEVSTINVQSFVDEQEWRLYNNVETRTDIVKKIYQSSHGKSNFQHSLFSATCHASRRYGFYIWNIAVVMFGICSLAFSTFSVEGNLPQNRLQLTFILLLTSVTFKYAVSSSLPRISYLTYLDKYLLSCMLVMSIICVWHAVIPIIIVNYYSTNSAWADRGVLIGLGTLYAVTQLGFITYIVFVPLRKRNHFRRNEKLHRLFQEKLDSLQKEELHDIRLSVVHLM